MSEIFESYKKKLYKYYPDLPMNLVENCRNLVSDNKINLPQSTLDQIDKFINLIFNISRTDLYKKNIKLNSLEEEILNSKNIKNYSTLMAFDFHISNGVAKLIEVNTNASGFLIADIIAEVHGQKSQRENLWKSFEQEIKVSGKNIDTITIIDEKPQEQNMYCEFLMYKNLFEEFGLNSEIVDVSSITSKDDKLYYQNKELHFFYNRYCDFIFSENESKHFLSSYLNGNATFSPNPKEYILLSDKKRLIEWSLDSWLNQLDLADQDKSLIKLTLPTTFSIQDYDKAKLWGLRKNFFFKPLNSYGSKSVYNGKSISRKNFDRLFESNTIVQTSIPPEKVNDWKYDIRVFCYKENIQLVTARSYQGQLTNFQNLGGGFCPVIFE